MKEPKYIAYRIDLKRFKEFYSSDEVCDFFKVKYSSISNRASDTKPNHIIGAKIDERWLIFNSDLKKSYVQQILDEQQDDKVEFPYRVKSLQCK